MLHKECIGESCHSFYTNFVLGYFPSHRLFLHSDNRNHRRGRIFHLYRRALLHAPLHIVICTNRIFFHQDIVVRETAKLFRYRNKWK